MKVEGKTAITLLKGERKQKLIVDSGNYRFSLTHNDAELVYLKLLTHIARIMQKYEGGDCIKIINTETGNEMEIDYIDRVGIVMMKEKKTEV